MIQSSFVPRGVCARAIHITLSDDGSHIHSVSFEGGCNGNLKAVASLVAGRSVDEVTRLLEGNTCGRRSTSCADQLVRALHKAQEEA